MKSILEPERVDTVVVGGGQAGLCVGYHLTRQQVPFVILDENPRIGDAWRKRWDSLRLFTPARFDALDGMSFPAASNSFPTKNEMGDYLEAYATRFGLPVRTGTRVDSVIRRNDQFLVRAGEQRFDARNLVVAMSNFQRPRVPDFAPQLDPDIVQFHSSAYRSPGQLRDGPVLIVGVGNSGAEIALEVSRSHPTMVAGRDTGHIPFRIDGLLARLFLYRLILRGVFHRILTVDTPMGRKARAKMLAVGGPLVRVRPRDLLSAGVTRVPVRVVGVRDGQPLLEDGQVVEAANVIWCTGFHPGFSWIHLPIHGDHEPRHERGVATDVPGLYFVGLHFLTAASSVMIHGVGRDAERIAALVAARRGKAQALKSTGSATGTP
jgi:putative flavoprotein involved in K+ transport